MPNVRPVSEKKYGISKHKFLQIYHFCMQYNEWLDELAYKTNTVKSADASECCSGGAASSATETLAVRRAELNRCRELVEQTCMEADGDIHQWLLKAVTNEGISYTYLKERMNIPCGKKMYYDRRRKFYWLMSKKI